MNIIFFEWETTVNLCEFNVHGYMRLYSYYTTKYTIFQISINNSDVFFSLSTTP